VDILIVNCSLFNPTPSLSAMIVNHFKMASNVVSYNLSGMGCSAGVISVSLARELLQVRRGAGVGWAGRPYPLPSADWWPPLPAWVAARAHAPSAPHLGLAPALAFAPTGANAHCSGAGPPSWQCLVSWALQTLLPQHAAVPSLPSAQWKP